MQKGRINILIYRITGTPAWAGVTTSIDADQANFKLQTVGRIGIVPMEMEGVFLRSGEIRITRAISATRVTEKQHPNPFT
ncbi:hypothetical protein ACFLTV_00865 [Chloroflexota bacterium]